jgi:riboflavin kinase
VTRISGKIETGQGVGAGFTRTDWALNVFREAYDIDPFPGTLNVRADAASIEAWRAAAAQGRLFKAPDPAWCDARCLRAKIIHQTHVASAVIVLPMVDSYPIDQIELVAATRLREWLEVRDGDQIALELEI